MKTVTERSKWIPEICAKCGGQSLDFREDTLVCIYDGWTYYLSVNQVEIYRKRLDKAKCGKQNKG